MRTRFILVAIALLVFSNVGFASLGGKLTNFFSKLGHAAISSTWGRAAVGVGTAAVITCGIAACDTTTVVKVTETVRQDREIHAVVSYEEIFGYQVYYIIDNIAWPYYAIDPGYGYPDVVDVSADYVSMEGIGELTAIPDHQAVGTEVSYLTPPPGDIIDPYYTYGKVLRVYPGEFYEIEIQSWSETYSLFERTELERTYTIIIDGSLSVPLDNLLVTALGALIWAQ